MFRNGYSQNKQDLEQVLQLSLDIESLDSLIPICNSKSGNRKILFVSNGSRQFLEEQRDYLEDSLGMDSLYLKYIGFRKQPLRIYKYGDSLKIYNGYFVFSPFFGVKVNAALFIDSVRIESETAFIKYSIINRNKQVPCVTFEFNFLKKEEWIIDRWRKKIRQ